MARLLLPVSHMLSVKKSLPTHHNMPSQPT